MISPRRWVRCLGPTLLATALFTASPSAGQDRVQLFAGDSIRVDRDLVGRVLAINGPMMTVVSRAQPRCRAGRMHGDAPICDPAPLLRQTVSLEEVTVERRMEKGNVGLRMVIGGLVGAAAFGTAGYFIGPEIGFGRVPGCVVGETCPGGRPPDYTQAEYDALQKSSDQKKGAFFFGVLGGTAVAIVVKRLSVGWVEIEPIVSPVSGGPLGIELTLPASR